MNANVLAIIGMTLVSIMSVLLILIADWRYRLIFMALLYAGVFSLISLSWPITMSVSKLIAGWIGCTVLGMALISLPKPTESDRTRSTIPASFFRRIFYPQRLYYFISSTLILILVFVSTPALLQWLPNIRLEQVWGALTLIGLGLLQVGFNSKPLPTTIGLLTILAGFEIVYAVIENSILVASLLTLITLGVSLAGAYLILSPQMEED